MDGMAPGYQPAHSEPPPCYNCGMRGHMFTACPEPTREMPAGLQASRARQQAGSERGEMDYPNKRHKGPIVTRYPHPSDTGPVINRYHPMPQGQQFPFGAPHNYPPPPPQIPHSGGHPGHGPNYPPHRPMYENYGPPPGPPGPPQSYGPPPFGQPPYYGPPPGALGPPGAPGPPGHYMPPGPPHHQRGPPQPFPPSHYPQQPPPPYGYPGPPQGPPPGPPPGPPQVYHQGRPYGPPQGPQEYPQEPPHRRPPGYPPPDYRPYPGPPGPPGTPGPPGPPHSYPSYSSNAPPNHQDPYRNEQFPGYPEYGRDRSRERHYPRDRHDDRREGWHSEGTRDDGGHGVDRYRDERSYEHARKGDQRFNKRRNRDGPVEKIHNRHHERRERHHSQNPPRNVETESEVEPSPLDTPTHVTSSDSKPFANLDAPATPNLPQDPTVNDLPAKPMEALDAGAEDSPAGTSDEALSEDDFAWSYEKIFQDSPVDHKGDAIGEPLPQEYSEKIMLPPAFGVTGVKSKYIKAINLDDFALSVRDSNHWSKYRHHPLFLDPTEITPKSIETYVRSVTKGRGHKNDQYDRFWRLPGFGKHRGRDQSRNRRDQRDRRDHYRQPDLPRKRKWEEPPHQAGGATQDWHHAPAYSMAPHDAEPKRPKDQSPEPGEVSDTGSASVLIPNHATPPIPSKEGDWREWSDNIEVGREYEYAKSQTPKGSMRNYDKQDRPLSSSDTRSRHDRDHRSSEPARRTGRSRSPGSRGRKEERSRRSESRRQRERSRSREFGAHRGRSYSPAHSRSPIGATRANVFAHIDQLYPPQEPQEFSGIIEGRGRDGEVAPPPPPPPQGRNPRRSSRGSRGSRGGSRPTSRHGRDSRRSSFGHVSQIDSVGSPLTPLEAELLGLAGHSSSDSDAGKRSPTRRQDDDHTPKFKRRQPKVDAAYSRRW